MNEEEMQRSIRTLEMYRAQLETFDQQYEFLAATLRDHGRAKETMAGYKDAKEGSETLIPIGGNSFLFAKAFAPDTAIVGLGADIAIETSMDEALTKMDERIEEIEEAMKSLNERYNMVANRAAEITTKIQSAYEGK